LEDNSIRIRVIQTHLSCRFHLVGRLPSLCWTWSQIIYQPRNFSEQVSRHHHIGQLKGDVPAMADYFRADHHQLFPQRGQRSVVDLLGQRQFPVRVDAVDKVGSRQ
jgi:hypothetical protein